VTTYTWDAADRLTGMTLDRNGDGQAETAATHTYDAAGQRQRSVVTSGSVATTTSFTYDGISLLTLASTTGTATTQLTYLRDELDHPRAVVVDAPELASPVTLAIGTTMRGDVVSLTDGAGATLATWSYDPYGKPVSSTVTTTALLPDLALVTRIARLQVLRYAGYVYDEPSGLYYLSQRYYDPATCQFISRDPVGADGEESAYQYCGGDPIGNTDPSGAFSIGDVFNFAKKVVAAVVKTATRVVRRVTAVAKKVAAAASTVVSRAAAQVSKVAKKVAGVGKRTTVTQRNAAVGGGPNPYSTSVGTYVQSNLQLAGDSEAPFRVWETLAQEAGGGAVGGVAATCTVKFGDGYTVELLGGAAGDGSRGVGVSWSQQTSANTASGYSLAYNVQPGGLLGPREAWRYSSASKDQLASATSGGYAQFERNRAVENVWALVAAGVYVSRGALLPWAKDIAIRMGSFVPTPDPAGALP
jgi:RHS repeat-associated protein